MKRIKLIFGLGLTMLLFLPAALQAQCDNDDFLDECASSLGTHTFIKAFHAESKKKVKTSEYSYVFSKGSTYMIVVCDKGKQGEKMIVNLYDRNHKLIASSYDKRSKKHYPDLVYPCPATGVYYLEATFENEKQACGVIILGFNK